MHLGSQTRQHPSIEPKQIMLLISVINGDMISFVLLIQGKF